MEAKKDKYFIDGFMLKHFDIWPLGVDKNNLLEEQKIFVMYLIGLIPEKSDWTFQIDYQKRLFDIENLNVEDIQLDQSDIDLVKIQGRNIEELKKERLKNEKEKRIQKLNEKFGIEQEKKFPIPEGLPNEDKISQQKELWDILQGKGLIKKK